MKTLNIITYVLISFYIQTYAQLTSEIAFPNLEFEYPVEILTNKDLPDRFYVVEQRGVVKSFPNNPDTSEADVDILIDIRPNINLLFNRGQELGLLGMAFDPDYKTNGYFYVYYTIFIETGSLGVRISRFKVSDENPNIADFSTEKIIAEYSKSSFFGNHNGGKIAFGPDGYLYFSVGDGGGANDPLRNGQNISTIYASIGRIDVHVDSTDGNTIENNPELPNGNYEIPEDNPFVGMDGLDEIYAYGLRNTWKFSFDSLTGKLWGADVGQGNFEEINLIEKGGNYGWSRFEAGTQISNRITEGESQFPIYFYNHDQGDVSITGGYVYRGTQLPDLFGKYIYADYVSGRIWALDYNPETGDTSNQLLFRTNGRFVSTFGTDNNNELYYAGFSLDGRIYKIIEGENIIEGNDFDGKGEWFPMAQGPFVNGIGNGVVNAMAIDKEGQIYIGGDFENANSTNSFNFAIYESETDSWQTFPMGARGGAVNKIKVVDDKVFLVGGFNSFEIDFSTSEAMIRNNIAVWENDEFKSFGDNSIFDGELFDIVINGQEIYVSGAFDNVGDIQANNVAKWNGSSWEALVDMDTNEAGTNNEVRSLAIDPITKEIYAGGNFTLAGGKAAQRIAKWNDTTKTWSPLGSGTSGFVEDILVTQNKVYIGGNFSEAGNQKVNQLAQWDKLEATWSGVGSGVNGLVKTLEYDGTYLYVGGGFSIASFEKDNYIVNGIARWNKNTGWESLGAATAGVSTQVNGIAIGNNDTDRIIYVGGSFFTAGNKRSDNAAVWINEDELLSVKTSILNTENQFYPNNVHSILKLPEQMRWKLYDISGKLLNYGNNEIIDFQILPVGIYILKLNNETFKILKY